MSFDVGELVAVVGDGRSALLEGVRLPIDVNRVFVGHRGVVPYFLRVFWVEFRPSEQGNG